MSVIGTDQWLLDSYHNPIDICENLKSYFPKVPAAEIYEYLKIHGMYRPLRQGVERVRALQKNKVWEIVKKDYLALQKSWGGPDIPIFIFPSDVTNRKIQRDFNGKSGLAFKDKLFLFLTDQNTEKEIRAVLTHEYNHVCRLAKFRKSEDQYVLLDTIILEGLAENAVRERLGTSYLANWTSYYTDEELEKMWMVLLSPNKNIKKTDRKHMELLYGLRRTYPKMLGYCIGYYLVKKYMEEKKLSSKELLTEPTHIIAGIE
ncbi:DUF2268 domain-containing putative Zn-dependent protease [Schinkia azotoformans]|uniref:DUF2268 domain-containing protein n=1 Tax=Schinkia azotoformans TaxID=1454 RepID=UPI002DBA14CC|nr:DUF2268 domain-containing protein [Schinkia azotoformans]MEC1716820.1 DUF2268 domain-containing protein [Schinkia azotoformans]MEC1743102.1 DUF2268 domain-containing protein [Schinkia azotoformans]MEC1744687.1 DUF2268 domain-containing protein [Schinkia azotoformans]MEC1767186.1 DUF2268 domain-containing protein [Schinkia azotoformans]MEC1780321.1 DUF2268 domain-containing protein [Schinkia azotoformans]